MGSGQKRNGLVVPQAANAMYNFKYEIANQIGVSTQVQGGYWGYISSRDCGAVGGNMVRKMMKHMSRASPEEVSKKRSRCCCFLYIKNKVLQAPCFLSAVDYNR